MKGEMLGMGYCTLHPAISYTGGSYLGSCGRVPQHPFVFFVHFVAIHSK